MWPGLNLFRRKKLHRPLDAANGFTSFHTRNLNAGWLIAAPAANRKAKIIRSRADVASLPRILLCVPDGNTQVGFLLATDGQAIGSEGDGAMGCAVPVVIERSPAEPSVKFLHPINPAWQLGLSADQGRSDGSIVFAHRAPNSDGAFALEQVETTTLPLTFIRAARDIAAHVSLPGRYETILSSVRNGVLRPDLAGAILGCLGIDELEALALRLLDDEPLRDLVRSCLPGDRWMSQRLMSLVEWRKNRDRRSSLWGRIDFAETDDIPGSRKPLAHRPKLGLALNALARRHTHPRRMACVVGSARNEGPYLLDWIAHHIAVGFDHVFIYTNDNTDGSDALLNLLARAGVVSWFNNETGPESLPQFRAYAHALSVLPDTLDYRWTLVADLDEYFTHDADQFRSVSEYLAWQDVRRAEAIALPWLIYVGCRDDAWRDASCPERFLKREPDVNHHVKSLFRTNLHWSSSCHNPLPSLEIPINYRAQNRMPHALKSPENNLALAHNPQATHAWIAHYIFKSAPEAMMKVLRGKGDVVRSERQADRARVMKPFVSLCDKQNLVQDTRTLKCAQGMREEISRLRKIPGVYECERSIKERFSAQMNEACMEFIREGRIEGEAKECAVFRSILQRQSHDALFSTKAA